MVAGSGAIDFDAAPVAIVQDARRCRAPHHDGPWENFISGNASSRVSKETRTFSIRLANPNAAGQIFPNFFPVTFRSP
jgi:hypothetical protein